MIDTVHASDYFKNLIKETFPNVIIDVVSDDSFSVEIPNISLIDFHAFASKHRFSLTCQKFRKISMMDDGLVYLREVIIAAEE